VADPAQVKRCYAEIFKRFRGLDVLVNNAGILQDGLLGMIGNAVVRRSMEVNAMGPLYNLQEASRLMSRHGGGSIVNVLPSWARRARKGCLSMPLRKRPSSG
jgi:3-oxoacyl-[acyl-carrier protein] reductase